MVESGRRLYLSMLGSGLLGSIAGCSTSGGTPAPTTPNEPTGVGSTAAINGIELTFVTYSLSKTLTYVPRRKDEVTMADEAENRETRTIEANEGRQFLVIVMRVANVSKQEKEVPVPGKYGQPPKAGEAIFLKKKPDSNTQYVPLPTNPEQDTAVSGAYKYDGTWMDRLTLALGAYRTELPPNTSVPGWMPFLVSENFDTEAARLVAMTNPEGGANRYVWTFDRP